MIPETEVNEALNSLYDYKYGGGIDQLDVRRFFENGYRILLRASGNADFLPDVLVDELFDGDPRDYFKASQDIERIFEGLR